MGGNDCVFCKMVAEEIPVTKIFEDDVVLSFLDIGPVSDGHVLVIPKQHFNRMDECPRDLLSEIGSRLGPIAGAVMKAMECEGYNVLCNNGRAAGQLVEHLHFHIIPRMMADGVFNRWPSYEYKEGKMETIAQKIRQCF